MPRARGTAQRELQDAEAYRERVIADAEGQSQRFLALLAEYQSAPRVTRDRLYLEAIEEVYGNSNKVIVDSESSGSLMYLPLDQLTRGGASRPGGGDSGRSTSPSTNNSETEYQTDDSRQRRQRQ